MLLIGSSFDSSSFSSRKPSIRICSSQGMDFTSANAEALEALGNAARVFFKETSKSTLSYNPQGFSFELFDVVFVIAIAALQGLKQGILQ